MAAGAPVAQGEETLSVTVSVTWAIKASQYGPRRTPQRETRSCHAFEVQGLGIQRR
jgi:hypothetical protein